MRGFLFSLFVALAGCGGSGGSTATDTPVTQPPDVIDRPLPDTDPVLPGDLPVTGRFAFAGQLSLDMPLSGQTAPTTLSSPLSLNIDFGATDAQVTGNADGFAGFDGQLFLSLGVIDRAASGAQPAIGGRISGVLKENAQSYLVSGQFDGDFRGTSQEAVRGRVTGSVLNNARSAPLTGSYQAARLP